MELKKNNGNYLAKISTRITFLSLSLLVASCSSLFPQAQSPIPVTTEVQQNY